MGAEVNTSPTIGDAVGMLVLPLRRLLGAGVDNEDASVGVMLELELELESVEVLLFPFL